MDSLTMPLSQEVSRVIQALDFVQTHRTYWEQNECIFLEQFLPPKVVEHHLLPDMEYVTNPAMGPSDRFNSSTKDAIAYFGFSAVLRVALRRQRRAPAKRTSRPPGRS